MDTGTDGKEANGQTIKDNKELKSPPEDKKSTQEITSSECSPNSSPQKKDCPPQKNSPHQDDSPSVNLNANQEANGGSVQHAPKNNECLQEHNDDCQDNATEVAESSQEASSLPRQDDNNMEEPTEEGSLFEYNGCGDEIASWMQGRLGDDSSIMLTEPTDESLSKGVENSMLKRSYSEMFRSSSSHKLPATKRRQRSQSTSQSAPPVDTRSPSRKRMDDTLRERFQSQMDLRDAHLALEKAKANVNGACARYNAAKARVETTAKEESESLLKEDTPWNEMFHQLKKYKEVAGDCNVKQNLTAEENKQYCKTTTPEMVRRLSVWVGKNRKEGKLGGRGAIIVSSTACKASKQINEEGKACEESDVEHSQSANASTAMAIGREEAAGMPPGDVLQHEDYGEDFNEDSIRADPYKQIALDSIGFDWNPRNSRWNGMYDELRCYKDKHGNTLVPHANFGLGAWVKRQQTQYTAYSRKDGTKSDLTEDRVRQLNDLGFVWSRRSNTWNENFQRLAKWKEANGSCRIPDNSKDPELAALIKWMADQRVHYKRQVADEEGNCSDDPNSADKKDCGEKPREGDGINSTKRKSKRKFPKLSPDQIEKLQSIGFEFDSRDAKWLQKLDVLLKYKQKAGDFLVPSTYPEDPTLSNWVASQRAQYKLFTKGSKSHMTERRLKILTDAGFPFSVNEVRQKVKKEAAHQDRVIFDAKSWLEKYKDFLLYIATHGSLESFQKNSPFLAEWLSQQRKEHSPPSQFNIAWKEGENVHNMELKEHGSLMEAAHSFLFSQNNKTNVLLVRGKNVEPTSFNKGEMSWDDHFGKIAAWYIKNGSYAPKGMPSKMKKFLSRCTEQHRLFTSGLDSELTSERIEKLEDICFPLDRTVSKEPRDDDITATRKNRSWEEYRLDLAISYIQNGTYDSNSLDDLELRRWAAEQKRQHKMYLTGKQTALDFGQIQKLVDIKFISKRPKQKSWPETCCDLMAFRIHFGTFDVASAHVVSKGRSANHCTALKNIQDWVVKLRGHYCESSDSVSTNDELTQDQKSKLDSVGFPWTGSCANSGELPDKVSYSLKEQEKTDIPVEGAYVAPIKSNLFGLTLEMHSFAI